MKRKYKISLLLIGILLLASVALGSSYALWTTTIIQDGVNVINSDCFEFTFEGNNNITLENAFPITDSQGVMLRPYTFTVTNICNHAQDLQINLENLNNSTLNLENLKFDINDHIFDINETEEVEPTLDNASSAIKLKDYILEANGSKKFNLRMWVKEDANQSDIENTSFISKITVLGTFRKDYEVATLEKGSDFNVALKTLAGNIDPAVDTTDSTITTIVRSNTAPQESDNAILVSDESSTNPIYAWISDGTINIYTLADKIYMNEDSSKLFMGFSKVTALDTSYFDTSKVFDMMDLFSGVVELTSLDVSNFDTSNVTNMRGMFYQLKKIDSIDVSHFNTSNVTNMQSMFNGMSKIKTLDLSNFDTSSVTEMNALFRNATSLTNIIFGASFDTSNVTNMTNMFANTAVSSLNLRGFNTQNVTNMSNMFSNCKKLERLDLRSFNTSNVNRMQEMFSNCNSLTSLDVSSFDTSNVTLMGSMFYRMSVIETLDLSSFDTSKVGNMSWMFSSCDKLKTIYVSDKFVTTKVSLRDGMFKRSGSLVGGAGTVYDVNHIDTEYAKVDDPDNGNPGYFTYKLH